MCNLYSKKLEGLIDQASVKSGHTLVRSVLSAFCLERQKSFVRHIVNPDFEHQFSYVFNIIICLHAIITILTKTHENIQLIMKKKKNTMMKKSLKLTVSNFPTLCCLNDTPD